MVGGPGLYIFFLVAIFIKWYRCKITTPKGNSSYFKIFARNFFKPCRTNLGKINKYYYAILLSLLGVGC
jgi:hypothetical protein